jgi:hypothetical protein
MDLIRSAAHAVEQAVDVRFLFDYVIIEKYVYDEFVDEV